MSCIHVLFALSSVLVRVTWCCSLQMIDTFGSKANGDFLLSTKAEDGNDGSHDKPLTEVRSAARCHVHGQSRTIGLKIINKNGIAAVLKPPASPASINHCSASSDWL